MSEDREIAITLNAISEDINKRLPNSKWVLVQRRDDGKLAVISSGIPDEGEVTETLKQAANLLFTLPIKQVEV